jgi:Ca2+-binding EF-hand superfamily protein
MRLPAVAMVLVGALALGAAGRPTSAVPPPPPSHVDLIFLDDIRPYWVRLSFELAGQPLGERWAACEAALFRAADRDHDGLLDQDELERMPSAELLLSNSLRFEQPPLIKFPEIDLNGDEVVNRLEWRAYFQRQGLPVRVQYDRQLGRLRQARNDALFKRLDRNGDGVLGVDELADAPKLLQALDANEDEMLTTEEILAGLQAAPMPTDEEPVMMMRQRPADTGAPLEARVLVMTGGDWANRIVQRAAARRDNRSASIPSDRVQCDELAWPPERFQALDQDRDGYLTTDELTGWSKLRPDEEIHLRWGPPPDVVATLFGRLAVLPPVWPAQLWRGGARQPLTQYPLHLGAGQLNIEAARDAFALSDRDEDQAAIFEEFSTADKDDSGRVEKAEARANAAMAKGYAMIDDDDDGVMTRAEVSAFLRKLDLAQRQALSAQVELRIAERGRSFFELFDTNGDGVLGLREMRQFAARAQALSQAAGGSLRWRDFPIAYDVVVRPRAARTDLPTADAAPTGARPATNADLSQAPRWFIKMDRNGDGDISPREFLGTLEDFRRLDRDGDGLISVAEAIAATQRDIPRR